MLQKFGNVELFYFVYSGLYNKDDCSRHTNKTIIL